MKTPMLAALMLSVMASGCATMGAVSQASDDHGCDPDAIRVLDEGLNSATLDVCGSTRHYRNFGREIPSWLDVTALISTPAPMRRPVAMVTRERAAVPDSAECTSADRSEMTAAGVSASAIASACDKR